MKKIWQAALAASAVAALSMAGVLPAQAAPGDVEIPDGNLRSCLNGALKQPADAAITEAQAASFAGNVECTTAGISSIAGLEAFTSVKAMNFRGNNITDLAPLGGLAGLASLSLERNGVADISSLAGMTGLEVLSLDYNAISDIAPLAGLSRLRNLGLYENNVADLSPLRDLVRLEDLDLFDNAVEDLAPLQGLVNLTYLRVAQNDISDISALAGLINLDTLVLSNNPLGDLSPLVGLPRLRSLALAETGLTGVTELSALSSLQELFIGNNRIVDVAPLAGLRNLDRLEAAGQRVQLNPISVGASQAPPFVTPNGRVVVPSSATAVVDPATGAWSFGAAGANTLTWNAPFSIGDRQFGYSGTILQTSVDSGLVVTGPAATSIAAGQDAVFLSEASAASGTNTVIWEASSDNGATWQAIPGATNPTLTIANAGVELTGTLYRATYTNSNGAVVSSAPALLTVTAPPAEPAAPPEAPAVPAAPGTPPAAVPAAVAASAPAVPELAETGARHLQAMAAGSLLLVIGGLLMAARRRHAVRSH